MTAPIEADAIDSPSDVTGAFAQQFGRSVLWIGVVSVAFYCTSVFAYGDRLGGVEFGRLESLAGFVAFAVFTAVLFRSRPFTALMSAQRQMEVGLALTAGVVSVIAGDTVVDVWFNHTRAQQNTAELRSIATDPAVWHAQLAPPMFAPLQGGFRMYKPGIAISGQSYGWMYEPRMLDSRTLRDSVLELHTLVIRTGGLGVRDTQSIASARVYALGDSFVFGDGTTGDSIWTVGLSARLHTPVYNLGISGASPPSEFRLLEYLLNVKPDSAHPADVLWMLFEGNDLGESGAAPTGTVLNPEGRGLSTLLDSTLLRLVVDIPALLKQGSVARKLLHREVATRAHAEFGQRAVDGVSIATPMFRSHALGPKMFYDRHIEVDTLSMESVLRHPGRVPIERAFDAMQRLAAARGFRVIVVIAPTDARVHSAQFTKFPSISTHSAVIEWFIATANAHGFASIDLTPALQAAAHDGLLYLRDDTHWNARGHAAVADILATELRRIAGFH